MGLHLGCGPRMEILPARRNLSRGTRARAVTLRAPPRGPRFRRGEDTGRPRSRRAAGRLNPLFIKVYAILQAHPLPHCGPHISGAHGARARAPPPSPPTITVGREHRAEAAARLHAHSRKREGGAALSPARPTHFRDRPRLPALPPCERLRLIFSVMAATLSLLLGGRVRAAVARCGFATRGVAGPGSVGREPDPDSDWEPEERELQEVERYRLLPGPSA